MMINCPRCGFTQPQDQYCAKCGVDMISFKPREKSLLQQFLGSTSSQLVVLMIFIAAAFVVYQVHNAAHRLHRLQAAGQDLGDNFSTEESSEGAADFSKRRDMPAPAMSKTDRAFRKAADEANQQADEDDSPATAPAASTSAPGVAPGVPPGGAAAAGSAKPTAHTGGADATPAAAAGLAPTQLRVTFAEVSKARLAEWVSDTKTTATQSGLMTAGVIADFEGKVKAASGAWRSLEAPIEQAFRLNQIILVYKGIHDEQSGQNIGLSLQITATAHDAASGTTVNVVGSRNLREVNTPTPPGTAPAPGSSQVVEVNFPEQPFTIPKGSAAFMSGTLLHRPLAEEEVRFYNAISVLRVMSSESYRTGSTDFVIFVEPR